MIKLQDEYIYSLAKTQLHEFTEFTVVNLVDCRPL